MRNRWNHPDIETLSGAIDLPIYLVLDAAAGPLFITIWINRNIPGHYVSSPNLTSLLSIIMSFFFVSCCKEHIRGLLGLTYRKCAVHHDSFIWWNTVAIFFANLMINAWFINGRGCIFSLTGTNSSSCPSNLTLLSSIKLQTIWSSWRGTQCRLIEPQQVAEFK